MRKVAVILLLCFVTLAGGLTYHRFFAVPRSSEGDHVSKVPLGIVNQVAQPASTTPSPAVPPRPSAVKGVIEGFYGHPWTQEQRIRMFQFMAHSHLNTYVYAPKDDPYQRINWNALYPPVQHQQLAELIAAAQSNGIEFVYSISPGIPAPLPGQALTSKLVADSMTYTSGADRARLENKIDQLRASGVHTVMLSFDDVEKTLKPADQQIYGMDYARAQVDVANELLQYEQQKDTSFRLWLAPTTYYGLADNHYWQTIRTHLNPSIQVIWTGKWVLNQSITSSQAMQVTKFIGRKPLLWDNYPVNDYTYAVKEAPALFTGPLEHRSTDLPEHLAGYIANPMLQPETSKIPLATIGLYLSNPRSYNPQTAWQYAITHTAGVADPAALLKFCQYASSSTLNDDGYAPFAGLAKRFWQTQSTAGRARGESALREELQLLERLPRQLHISVTNQALLSEVDPWLTKLAEEGHTGQLALAYLDMSRTDPGRPIKRAELLSRLRALQGNSLEIGDDLIAFIQQAVAH